MPKKPKIVQSKNDAQAEAGGPSPEAKAGKAPRPRRAAMSRKKSGAGAKKLPSMQGAEVSSPREIGATAEPSDEQVRLLAYFISERRRRFALPGDAESDWLEAKRQLLSEADGR